LPELPSQFLARPLAHRGLHGDGRVENTRAAVQAAIEAGYGIEIDVQLSADGEAMVFHDNTLDRLTGGTGPLNLQRADDLRDLHLTGTAEGVPTLAEIFSLVAGRAPLLVEIKDQDGALGPAVGPLERRVAELASGYTGPLAVMSFNPHGIATFALACPLVPRGLVTSAFGAANWAKVPTKRRRALATLAEVDRLGCDFISHDARALDTGPVARVKIRGLPILCWTVRSERQEQDARRIADNITFEGYMPARP